MEKSIEGTYPVKQIEKSQSLVDQAYETIRRAIISGRIEPGDWLRQESLAEELGVSSRTVREALGRLVAEGLAVREPYKGVRTVAPSVEEMQEIYYMRALLEGWAMELAASHLSQEQLVRMRELLPQTAADLDTRAGRRATKEANREFHWIPIRATGRRHLIRMLELLWQLLPSPHVIIDSVVVQELATSGEKDRLEHAALLDALEARDGSRAREAIVLHINRRLDYLRVLAAGEETAAGKA